MTSGDPSLEELYERVSAAIHRAEGAEASGDRSLAANLYFDVSCLEEEIAEQVPAADVEGAIARRGVITASLRAGQCARARAMADRYLAESGIGEPLRAKLTELRAEAERGLRATSGVTVLVRGAARFRFHVAA